MTPRRHTFRLGVFYFVGGLLVLLLLTFGFSRANVPAGASLPRESQMPVAVGVPGEHRGRPRQHGRRKLFSFPCTAAEIAQNVKKDWSSSHCPMQPWLRFHTRPTDRPSVVVSVGCNTGTDFIASLREWSSNSSFSVVRLREIHREFTNDTGQCHRAWADSPISGKASLVRGFCIEPMQSNYNLLVASFERMGILGPVTVTFGAAGATPGWVVFPNSHPGTEHYGVSLRCFSFPSYIQKVHGASMGQERDAIPNDAIPMLNLDNYLEEAGVEVIDWLSIDTEGNDVRVIAGLSAFLSSQRVRAFEFEVHVTGHWGVSSLQDTVDLLDNMGYTCYWQTNSGGLVQISRCWSDAYLKQSWKNVACVLRTEPLFSSMHALAWLQNDVVKTQ